MFETLGGGTSFKNLMQDIKDIKAAGRIRLCGVWWFLLAFRHCLFNMPLLTPTHDSEVFFKQRAFFNSQPAQSG